MKLLTVAVRLLYKPSGSLETIHLAQARELSQFMSCNTP